MVTTQEPQATSERAVDDEILQALLAGDNLGVVRQSDKAELREIVHKGDEDLPAPIVARVYQDAGVRQVYAIATGDPSLVSVNMLPAQLRKLGPDGKRMFSLHRPDVAVRRGTLKCMLHSDERAAHPEYDQWGLPTCRKANLVSPLQVEMHMQRRHKVEWATIEREREKAEKEEERTLQRQIAAAAVARSAEAPPERPKKTASG